MKLRKVALLLIFAGLAAAGSAADRREQTTRSQQILSDTSVENYTGKDKVLFLYSEGIKNAEIYDDTAKAIYYFDAAIAADPSYAPAYYHAASAIGQTDPKRALEYCLAANKLDSTNQWYRTQLGRLYLINEEVEKARVLYENEVKRNPRNPENYSMLAMIYQFNRQPYRAIMLLDSAETYLGRTDMLTGYKREILMSVGLYDRAIAESEAMIRDNPYDYSNYLALAEIYAATNKDSLAMANFEAAKAINPEGVDILSALNDYYMSRGDMQNFFSTAKELILNDQIPRDAKLRFYEELVRNMNFYRENFAHIDELAGLLLVKYPKDFEVMSLYAQNKINSGNLETALDFYKRMLNDSTPDIRVFNMVLDMEAFLNRGDSVAKYAVIAQEFFPKEPELYIRQGQALAHYMQKTKEAVSSFKKAMKLVQTDSARSTIYGMIGDAYQYGGKLRKCIGSYEKALRLWPENILVLNNYSYFLSEQDKDLKRALEMSKKVMESEPGNATYIDTYGWILFKLGLYKEAKEQLVRAISLDSTGSEEIFLHYGDVLHALGEDFLAPIYWHKALDAGYDKEEIEERLKKLEQQ